MASEVTAPVYPARWVPTLYFAEGLPFVAIAMVSALMYKNMGIADAQITFWTSLVMIPWTLKPLWGPVLEMFKTKKHFVVGTQFIGGVTFGFLALTLPLDGFFRYSLALCAEGSEERPARRQGRLASHSGAGGRIHTRDRRDNGVSERRRRSRRRDKKSPRL